MRAQVSGVQLDPALTPLLTLRDQLGIGDLRHIGVTIKFSHPPIRIVIYLALEHFL